MFRAAQAGWFCIGHAPRILFARRLEHRPAVYDGSRSPPGENRFNDGRVDASGRLWAGSVYPPKDYNGANIYSLNPDGVVTHQVGDLLTANGIAFSPDSRTLYYADTPSHAIMAADFDLAAGTISNTRVFHQFPHGQGRPDGACVDSEGYYWTALYEGGRVVRLNPAGEIVQEIHLPVRCPTMPAFGGADLKPCISPASAAVPSLNWPSTHTPAPYSRCKSRWRGEWNIALGLNLWLKQGHSCHPT